MLIPTDGSTISDYRTAIYAGNQTHVKIHFMQQDKTFTDEHIAIDGGITVTTIANHADSLTVGNVITTEVNINFINSSAFDNLWWTYEFQLFFGVDFDDETHWISIGIFKGERPKFHYPSKIIHFTARDRMYKLENIADNFLKLRTSVGYQQGMELRTFFRNISTYLFANVQQLIGTYIDFNKTVTSINATNYPEFFVPMENEGFQTGLTFKQVFTWIAEATGRIAYFDNNGDFQLVSYKAINNSNPVQITERDYYEFEYNRNIVNAKNSVVLIDTANDYAYKYPSNGTIEYKVLDNPIMCAVDQNNQEVFMTAILNTLSAVGNYNSSSLEAVGDWTLQHGDKITVTYGTNKTLTIPIFNRTLYWSGSCSCTYESPASNSTEEELTPKAKEEYVVGGQLNEKLDKKNVANNLTTTIEGYVLDARQGKVLNDKIDGLSIPGFVEFVLSANSSIDISVPNSFRGYFVATGAHQNSLGMYIVTTTSSGAIRMVNIAQAGNLTITASTNNLQLDNTTTTTIRISFFCLSGVVSEAPTT